MSAPATLAINGAVHKYDKETMPRDVAGLLDGMALPHHLVVVEVNGSIVKRNAFADKALADGDQIEIVKLVGGG